MNRLAPLRAGLGLRRSMLPELEAAGDLRAEVDFFEVAPENWLGIGGRLGKAFRRYTERYPFICHGLSLSLGGPDPLDEIFLQRLKGFLDEHGVVLYSEHLSWCSDGAHLYDLLPIPFTADAVKHVAARIRRTQDILGRRIAVENASFYTPLASELSEPEFLLAILAEADCDLLLDVNNVYVNARNHGFDPQDYFRRLPAGAVREIHLAGHEVARIDGHELRIDTHDRPVCDAVWALYASARAHFGPVPALVEWDAALPPLATLVAEAQRADAIA